MPEDAPQQFWTVERIPPETVSAVRTEVGRVVDAIIAEISADNPEYAQVLADPAGIGIRFGIEQAITTFLDAVAAGQPPSRGTDEVWRRLGEAEFQAGRSLEGLRDAFRTGTRAAWRAAAQVATEVGVDTRTVIALAEGIFVYSDALAADVVEGYLRIQSDEAGELQRRRRRLAALLIAEDQDPEVLERAVELARWPLPRTLAVLAVEGDSALSVARHLDAHVLDGAGPEGPWLVIPDPGGPGRMDALRHAVQRADAMAALGPTLTPGEGHASLRLARVALELVRGGVLPDDRPACVTDHLATVMVLRDRDLARALVRTRLAPLGELAAGERERLLETLEAWLAHQRHTPAVATALHVHPQTVRYRMGRLRELLGASLDDPEGRFELQLALRARHQPS